jgi:hypothetical protein
MMAIAIPAFLRRCIHRNATDRFVQIAKNALFQATFVASNIRKPIHRLFFVLVAPHHSKIKHKSLSIRNGEFHVRIQNP